MVTVFNGNKEIGDVKIELLQAQEQRDHCRLGEFGYQYWGISGTSASLSAQRFCDFRSLAERRTDHRITLPFPSLDATMKGIGAPIFSEIQIQYPRFSSDFPGKDRSLGSVR